METLIDIIDNGRRIVSLKYTPEELNAVKAKIEARNKELQRKYDIENGNTIKDDEPAAQKQQETSQTQQES